jgi:hypothetical protein
MDENPNLAGLLNEMAIFFSDRHLGSINKHKLPWFSLIQGTRSSPAPALQLQWYLLNCPVSSGGCWRLLPKLHWRLHPFCPLLK